jgi:DNA-binding NtrC family response regulator
VGGTHNPNNKLVTLEEYENDYILKVLKITGFNISRAAETLGITRARLYRKIDQFELRDALEEEGAQLASHLASGGPAGGQTFEKV